MTWWKFYLYRFLDDFILIYPVYTLLFQDNGLSTFQISLLLMVWSTTTVLLEVPTGILADRFSRKKLLIFAEIIRAIGYAFWLVGGSFAAFTIGFILWGIKCALMSGTFDALIYDEMKAIGKENEYEKVNGRIKTSGFIGVSLALVLGGYLAEFGYALPLALSIVSTLGAGITISLVRQTPIIISTQEEKYFIFLKKALLEAVRNPKLLGIIVFISLAYGAYGAADELFALLFKEYGLSLSMIGLASSIKFMAFALAGISAGYIFPSSNNLEIYTILIAAGLFFLITFLNNPLVLILIFFASFLFGVSEVKLESKLQRLIESHRRATILSFKSLLLEAVTIIITLIMGITVHYFGIASVLYVLSIFVVSGALLSSVISNHFKRDN